MYKTLKNITDETSSSSTLQPYQGLEDYRYVNKDAIVYSTGAFSVVATLANLCLMITILVVPKLRTSSQYILIFALSLCGLFSGVVEYPLYTEYFVREKWIHDCSIFNMLQFDSWYILNSISCLLIISVCVDFILRIMYNQKRVLIIVAFVMIVTAVVTSVAILLPLLKIGTHNVSYVLPCQRLIKEPYATIIRVFSIQVFGILQMAILVCAMYCCSPRGFAAYNPLKPRSFPWDIILAAIITMVGYLPYRIWLQFFSTCSGSGCKAMYISRAVLSRLQYLPPCLVPLVWLLGIWLRRREASEEHANNEHKHEMGTPTQIYSTRM